MSTGLFVYKVESKDKYIAEGHWTITGKHFQNLFI